MRLMGILKIVTYFLLISSTLVADTDDRLIQLSAKTFNFTNMTKAGKIAGSGNEGGHGVAFIDVDNDGDLDIYVTNVPSRPANPTPNYLYINNGKGVFKNQAVERKVAGLNDYGSHGVVFADVDFDGDFDLLVGNAGSRDQGGQNRLYLNNGSGYFVDATASSGMLNKRYRTRGIAVGDFTGDGLLDYIITNPLLDTDSVPNAFLKISRLFKQKRQEKLRFSSVLSGLKHSGFTQGITTADVDGDGDLDITESKYAKYNYRNTTNSLWINNGKGSFKDGSGQVGDSFQFDGQTQYNGTAFADIDNDGDLDMIAVSSQHLRLYSNDGKGNFTEITKTAGVYGRGYTAAFGDLNNDGWQDIVIAQDVPEGHAIFKNRGNGKFILVTDSGVYPPAINDPRGLALGDYDDDGDLDIVIVHKNSIAQLFRNNINNKSYIKFRFTSLAGEKGVIGTKVWLYRAGENFSQKALLGFREIGSSTGYISQNSPEVHFATKREKTTLDIIIRFPDGAELIAKNITPGRTFEINLSARWLSPADSSNTDDIWILRSSIK